MRIAKQPIVSPASFFVSVDAGFPTAPAQDNDRSADVSMALGRNGWAPPTAAGAAQCGMHRMEPGQGSRGLQAASEAP